MVFINFAQRREKEFFFVRVVWPHINLNCFCVPCFYLYQYSLSTELGDTYYSIVVVGGVCFFSTCSLRLNSVIGLYRHNYVIYTTYNQKTFDIWTDIKVSNFSMIWSFLMWTSANLLVTNFFIRKPIFLLSLTGADYFTFIWCLVILDLLFLNSKSIQQRRNKNEINRSNIDFIVCCFVIGISRLL